MSRQIYKRGNFYGQEHNHQFLHIHPRLLYHLLTNSSNYVSYLFTCNILEALFRCEVGLTLIIEVVEENNQSYIYNIIPEPDTFLTSCLFDDDVYLIIIASARSWTYVILYFMRGEGKIVKSVE